MLKKLLLGAVCLLWVTIATAQAKYYWTDGAKLTLTENSSTFIIHTKAAAELTTLAAQTAVPGFKTVSSFAHKGYAVVTPNAPMTEAEMLSALGLSAADVQIASGEQYDDGFTIYPTMQVVYRPLVKENAPSVRNQLRKFDYENVEEKYGVYRVTIADVNDAFEIANDLYESGLVAFALPDFYAPKQRYADPLFNEQFQMHNTGQTIDGVTGVNDMDCNALEAWGITLGSASITVAVIDDGLEDHEDLVTSTGASRYINGFTPANNGNGDAINGSNHGVACAGSIAASHNNIGVQGVAPLVQLTSVNIFFGGESTQDIADGITWAKNNGADVMSNSWGYTSCTANFSNINSAIADANSNGRGGLGTLVVFAAGNGYKSCVDYPGNNSNVVAVGAFTNQGVRSSYSNYGPALDIMAPSNAVGSQPGAGVRTTDRMGGPGYNSSNYTSTFGGTSSATPVVAGVAALVLGYNASLTSAQLKNILYSTAIDMGPTGNDNEYANGRVNALAALQAAGGGGGPTCSDGIQNGQETGVDCGGPTCPACPTSCNDNEVTLTIILDNYPEETSWSIVSDGGATVASGGTYGNLPDGSTFTEDICLPDGCYTFTINDSYGDGICCAYGNGSYSLTEGGSTLASGGSFTSSEATPFCVGGGGADTQPPSTPTNLSASNITQTTADLSWNASSDNVGVAGYNVYQGATLLGTTTNTSTGITGLTASTTYTFSVSAYDDAGNESGTASVTFTTASEPGGGPETVFGHFFESGLDGWIDGGSDCFRYSGSRSYEGSYSIRLRDNSGVASSMTSSSYNLSSYSSVELEFYFYPNSMENGEDFWVRYNDGSGWQTVATYARGSSFENGQFYVATVTLDGANYNLSSNAQFRFQCDASANQDQIYIDAVTLTGNTGASGSNVLADGGAQTTIEAIPGLTLASENDLGDYEVFIAPNPASDLITVRADEPILRLSLMTIDGKLLLSQPIDGVEQTQLNVSDLPTGIYFVQVQTVEERITERVVIKR